MELGERVFFGGSAQELRFPRQTRCGAREFVKTKPTPILPRPPSLHELGSLVGAHAAATPSCPDNGLDGAFEIDVVELQNLFLRINPIVCAARGPSSTATVPCPAWIPTIGCRCRSNTSALATKPSTIARSTSGDRRSTPGRAPAPSSRAKGPPPEGAQSGLWAIAAGGSAIHANRRAPAACHGPAEICYVLLHCQAVAEPLHALSRTLKTSCKEFI